MCCLYFESSWERFALLKSPRMIKTESIVFVLCLWSDQCVSVQLISRSRAVKCKHSRERRTACSWRRAFLDLNSTSSLTQLHLYTTSHWCTKHYKHWRAEHCSCHERRHFVADLKWLTWNHWLEITLFSLLHQTFTLLYNINILKSQIYGIYRTLFTLSYLSVAHDAVVQLSRICSISSLRWLKR